MSNTRCSYINMMLVRKINLNTINVRGSCTVQNFRALLDLPDPKAIVWVFHNRSFDGSLFEFTTICTVICNRAYANDLQQLVKNTWLLSFFRFQSRYGLARLMDGDHFASGVSAACGHNGRLLRNCFKNMVQAVYWTAINMIAHSASQVGDTVSGDDRRAKKSKKQWNRKSVGNIAYFKYKGYLFLILRFCKDGLKAGGGLFQIDRFEGHLSIHQLCTARNQHF